MATQVPANVEETAEIDVGSLGANVQVRHVCLWLTWLLYRAGRQVDAPVDSSAIVLDLALDLPKIFDHQAGALDAHGRSFALGGLLDAIIPEQQAVHDRLLEGGLLVAGQGDVHLVSDRLTWLLYRAGAPSDAPLCQSVVWTKGTLKRECL